MKGYLQLHTKKQNKKKKKLKNMKIYSTGFWNIITAFKSHHFIFSETTSKPIQLLNKPCFTTEQTINLSYCTVV